jgi:molecular chaperone DnaK
MAKDAEAHAAEDRKYKDTIDARNRGDAMVYNVEKMLREHREKISGPEAKQIEDAVEETKRVIREGNVEQINAATDKLTQASHKLAEVMYRAAAQPGGDAGATQEPPKAEKEKENVVDAEFVDVDDKKK